MTDWGCVGSFLPLVPRTGGDELRCSCWIEFRNTKGVVHAGADVRAEGEHACGVWAVHVPLGTARTPTTPSCLTDGGIPAELLKVAICFTNWQNSP